MASAASARSSRVRQQPVRLEDEQAQLQLAARELIDIRLAISHSLTLGLPSATESDVEGAAEEREEAFNEEDEKKDDMAVGDTAWSSQLTAIQLPSFSFSVGPAAACRHAKSAFDFFSLLIPQRFIAEISNNTNLYAQKQHAGNAFTKTTAADIQCFIAILISMGMCVQPQLKSYWRKQTKHPFISSLMRRDRFMSILRFFHMNAHAVNTRKPDPLYKIRPLLNEINANSSSVYHPSQRLSVDEAMIPFKGRNIMKQYLPKKPTKWGFRAWVLADCMHPYSVRVDIYTGKQHRDASEPLSSSVVKKLLEPFFNRNHIIYLDNFFSGNTINHIPFILFHYFLQRGDSMHRQKGQLVASVWHDKAPIYFLSTCVSSLQSSSVKRRNDEGKEEEIKCPAVVIDYNKYAHAVDTVNQMRDSYRIGRRSRKWWRPVVWWLIDIAIINAYTLARLSDAGKWKSQLQFREQLIEEMANHAGFGGIDASAEVKQKKEEAVGHYPFKFDTPTDCKYCSMRSKSESQRTRTPYGCDVCGVHLCIFPCFRLFHEDQANS